MKQTRWGIIGPGDIAHNFADGSAHAATAMLATSASQHQVTRPARM